MWLESLLLRNVRILEELALELDPGLNVFVGSNGQGKTSILEGVGILSKARSFRADDTAAISRGAAALRVSGLRRNGSAGSRLEVEIGPGSRRFRVDGQAVAAREYAGRLEVALYSSERLRLVRGSQRERRAYLDRAAAALWPAYRRELGEFGRALAQRNAALLQGGRDLEAWSERFAPLAARVRRRRQACAERLNAALASGFRPAAESYGVELQPQAGGQPEAALVETVRAELRQRRSDELRARRSLVGPQRDRVLLLVDAEDIASASSGQARSLLLALTIAALDVYAAEHGQPAVALLDDLDSELDAGRLALACAELGRRGQALVTTAHEGWVGRSVNQGRVFLIERGRQGAAGASVERA